LKVPLDGSALALERPKPCFEKNSPVRDLRACANAWVAYGSILLKKYFGGVERNLQELLLRFLRSDARDYITSPKNDHGASYRHYGASALRNRPKTDICEIFGVVRFSTFSTLSVFFGHDRPR
jgi:hypothetical protein